MSNTSSILGCSPSVDASFGPVVQSCRDDFDFTIAFEQYIFAILPASLLLIAAPLRIKQLAKLPNVVTERSLRSAKLAAVAAFAILQLTLIILWSTQAETLDTLRPICIAASCVSFVASLMFCALSYTEHARSIRPSMILNAYLFVSVILDAAMLRTYWLAALPDSIRAVSTASFALKATLLILEAIVKTDRRSVGSEFPNPEATSGLYGQGLFTWLNPLLLDGFRRLLKPGDLYVLDDAMLSRKLNGRFWHAWNQSTSQHKHKLLWICLKTLKWQLCMAVLPRLFMLAFTICQPLVLARFLNFLEDPSENASAGYGLIGAYGLVYLGIAISSSFYHHRSYRSVTMLRGILMSAVFAKSTEQSIASDNTAAVTLMSTDVDAIIRAFREIHEFWANTIQIGLAVWLLSSQIGFAAVGPVIVSVVALLLTIAVSPFAQSTMVAWLEMVQKRISITSTMLGHMKSVKMSGLSTKLSTAIADLRVQEMKAATPFRLIGAASSAVAQIPILISPVAAFALFTINATRSGQSLDAPRMFASISLIILLGQPLFWMFETIIDIMAALGCFDRIQKYLSLPSRSDYRSSSHTSPAGGSLSLDESTAQLSSDQTNIELQDFGRGSMASAPITSHGGDFAVEVRSATFSWSTEGQPILDRLSFSIKSGQLAIVVGPVASGKSTLLKGLLGEVPHVTGQVSVLPLRLSWCEQTPWLINDTVRNNIIGYSDFDPDLYQQVIHACDLEKDFSRLSNGDETMVGSKGIVLSGGQKQRVALARAAYARPQIALFDDVLSGLDSRTANTVFERLFGKRDGLFRSWDATVVLATQTVKFLPSSDLVLALDKDRHLVEQGPFGQLTKSGIYVKALYGEHVHDEDIGPAEENDSTPEEQKRKTSNAAEPDDERRQLGDFTVYRYFFSNVGVITTMVLLLVEVAWAFLSTFPTVWLKFWADANTKHPNQDIGYYLGVYASLQTLGVLCFFALCFFGLVTVATKSGINLHNKLLHTVMLAPISLFATTDIGSLINRFSQDIGLLDRSLPLALLVSIANLLVVIGTAALIASSTGFVALSFPLIVALFYFLQKAYLRTSRQLRYLDLEEKAPVYTQFLETISGLPTIRAFAWEPQALARNHHLVDRAQRPFYLLLMIQQWLTLVLDLIVAGLAVLIVGLAVRLRGSVSVGLTGVALVQLITLAETLKLLIQFWTSLETSIGAVARIKNFSEETRDENLPGEEKGLLPEGWPGRGEVRIRGVAAVYGEDLGNRALDGVTLEFAPGQKIGVCGRTGSGKSSFILSILRMLDLSSGSIVIDGVDLSTVSREEVRSRLIAITQDSFFLPGTVLQNIDPYEASTLPAITEALTKVGLWETIQSKGGLDTPFEEEMLSHGQRQLFSLARAILRKGHQGGKVVLMDEATSSVDSQTDAIMQRIIREEFAEYTVVSIAHRLETIADFDRVVVLERGCVVEEGRPQELLAGGGTGRFKQLWNASRHRGEAYDA